MKKVNVAHLNIADFTANESVRSLRTNFLSLGVSAVALTSFGRHAGTTSLSFRLAASLAAAGKRTLLIEADMRTGNLASDLAPAGEVKGLYHCLSGTAELSDAALPTDIDNLHIVFAGENSENASELLTFDTYEKLISSARAEFDFIIVDTPPVGQVTDCAAAARALDGVILVTNAKHNHYKLEQSAIDSIEAVGARFLGIILNRADYKDKGGYYGKAHSGKYGYDRKK